MLGCFFSKPGICYFFRKKNQIKYLIISLEKMFIFFWRNEEACKLLASVILVLLFLRLPPDPGQAEWIYVDTIARPQWDSWESLRIVQVVQNALIQVGAGGAAESTNPAVRGLPAATPQPAAATLGPRQLLAQAWRVKDMRTFEFEPPSCATQVNSS